jgi:uncharacterized membrane protein YphA (DoxX/SURF4 family)
VALVAECLVVVLGSTSLNLTIQIMSKTSQVAITDGSLVLTGGQTRTLNAVVVITMLVTTLNTKLFNAQQQVNYDGGAFNVST